MCVLESVLEVTWNGGKAEEPALGTEYLGPGESRYES